jgi:hypothetical protein
LQDPLPKKSGYLSEGDDQIKNAVRKRLHKNASSPGRAGSYHTDESREVCRIIKKRVLHKELPDSDG